MYCILLANVLKCQLCLVWKLCSGRSGEGDDIGRQSDILSPITSCLSAPTAITLR